MEHLSILLAVGQQLSGIANVGLARARARVLVPKPVGAD
jgi:hypothetical protein